MKYSVQKSKKKMPTVRKRFSIILVVIHAYIMTLEVELILK